MVGKQAFLRTAEAVIAIAISLVFLTLLIPGFNPAQANQKNENVLEGLARDVNFRQCILQENRTCLNQSIYPSLSEYHYEINISTNVNDKPASLPAKKIFSESIMVAGNSTLYNPRILRIYYWDRT